MFKEAREATGLSRRSHPGGQGARERKRATGGDGLGQGDLEGARAAVIGPGRVGEWVRMCSSHPKVAGSVPGQGTHRNQPVKA